MVQNNGFWNGDVLIEKNNGAKFYMQTMVNAIKDKTGKINGLCCRKQGYYKEARDKKQIRFEQKKSQLDLIKEQQQFNTFMEHAPTLAWINDEDGILYYMNTLFKNSLDFQEMLLVKIL